MKKNLVMFAALLLVVAVAVPAFAVDFKYGGEFRTRFISNDNNIDGSDETNDNQTFIDQRLRLFFTFIASENLRLVTGFEVGDMTWGNMGGVVGHNGRNNRVGPGTGGGPGADSVNIETKRAYIEFNVPTTPVTAFVGLQGINLLSSWIVDDDFAAAVLRAKFDPITARVGYIAGQVGNSVEWDDRIDSWFLAVDYKEGPFAGSLIGFYQLGRDTIASADPSHMVTPFTNPIPTTIDPLHEVDDDVAEKDTVPWGAVLAKQFDIPGGGLNGHVEDNNLFDLGLNLAYKIDWLSAYINFVKNLGGLDVFDETNHKFSADYTGFMIDGGLNYFCGPYTLNVGGFYTTGDELRINERNGNYSYKEDDINRFVYPLSTQKYFSEILGGGILDNNANIAHTNEAGGKDYQWTGYGWPSNIWTVTVGGAWQVLEKTKLSGSYWYFGTSEEVVGKGGEAASDLGHELDFYVTQGIVDGLTLDLVGAYLIKGDAYSAAEHIDDAYEVGARLQWNF